MPMKLRSGKITFNTQDQPFRLILAPEKFHKKTYSQPQDVSIDFDEASKEWRKNKISLGEGMFKYKRNKR